MSLSSAFYFCSMGVNLGRMLTGCWSLLAHLGFQRALSFLVAHDVLRNPEYTSWKIISLSQWCVGRFGSFTTQMMYLIMMFSVLLDDSFILRMGFGQLLILHHHIRWFPFPMAWLAICAVDYVVNPKTLWIFLFYGFDWIAKRLLIFFLWCDLI